MNPLPLNVFACPWFIPQSCGAYPVSLIPDRYPRDIDIRERSIQLLIYPLCSLRMNIYSYQYLASLKPWIIRNLRQQTPFFPTFSGILTGYGNILAIRLLITQCGIHQYGMQYRIIFSIDTCNWNKTGTTADSAGKLELNICSRGYRWHSIYWNTGFFTRKHGIFGWHYLICKKMTTPKMV